MTHGDRTTYPRLAEPLGFCTAEQAADLAWHLATIQRDYGDRSNRKQARFKYTVARLGIDFIRAELSRRAGFDLPPFEDGVALTHRSDMFGWRQQPSGAWDLGLFIIFVIDYILLLSTLRNCTFPNHRRQFLMQNQISQDLMRIDYF